MLGHDENILQADQLVQSALDSLKSSGVEASFDSGYCTSPVKFTAVRPTGNQQLSANTMFQSNPLRSPFKINTDSNSGHITHSPIKTEPSSVFSPFKESSLSPFKLLNQSPSKGAYDDWEKELFAGCGEILLGVGDTESIVDELLKSPQGKAFLESNNSPLRNNGVVARRLRISPENNKQTGHRFQSLHDQSSDVFNVPSATVKTEPFDDIDIDGDSTITTDHMYGQQHAMYVNSLCAIDPNKIGATPSKPRFTNVENAPIRKLYGLVPSVVVKQETIILENPSNQQLEQTWPSRERLKFARHRFQEILGRAVANEIELIKEERRRKGGARSVKREDVKTVKSKGGKGKSGKETKGGKKSKTYRKRKKDSYPQIKLALAKPVKQRTQPPVIHKNLFPAPVPTFTDPGWYPSDEDEAENTWTGPPPFYTQTSGGMYSDDESSEEESDHTSYEYETISGRRVIVKRPRLF